MPLFGDKKDEALTEEQQTSTDLSSLHPSNRTDLSVVLPAALLTTACLGLYHVYRRQLRRYATINHLPAAIYNPKNNKGLLGYVTSVGDGDNFRFFHTPGGYLAGWHWLRAIPTERKDLKDQTIHVRMAGVDAPELAHFGKPAQPYGQEALDWLRAYLTGRRVRVIIHSRDRFDRVVGNPKIRLWPYKWVQRDVGLEQIKAGLATVFRQGGAEYGGLKEVMERAEAQAKKAKKGMWARGKALETPAEYKRRTRSEDYQDTSTTTRPQDRNSSSSAKPGVARQILSWMRWSIGK